MEILAYMMLLYLLVTWAADVAATVTVKEKAALLIIDMQNCFLQGGNNKNILEIIIKD